MGVVLRANLDDWSRGVVTTTELDSLPPNASPSGHNSVLVPVGGTAAVAKRAGIAMMNATPAKAPIYAASFDGDAGLDAEVLERANTADVQVGNGAFSISGWFYLDATDNWDYWVLLHKGTDDGANTDIRIYFDSDDGINATFCWDWDGGEVFDVTATVTIGAWHFLTLSYASGVCGVLIDDGSTNITHSLSGGEVAPVNSTGPFKLGHDYDDGMQGYLWRWGKWDRALTGEDHEALYNSGAGLPYASLAAAQKVDLAEYWDLEEVGPGTRACSIGGNNLTDTASNVASLVTGATTGAAIATTGQAFYKYRSGSVLTSKHLLISDRRLDSLSTGGTLTLIDEDLFTAGTPAPSHAIAQDMIFMVNGTDAIKYNGTTTSQFGITRPTVGAMAGTAGIAGSHNGTYELMVTYGNSATGAESSASNTAASTVTCSNQKIDWADVPVSTDPQVDTRYLYVRNTASQAYFYRVATISDNTTTTATTNQADADLITLAPYTYDHEPPPTGARYLAWHRNRMFVATSSKLYYSTLGQPEEFNLSNYEDPNPDDGQLITGLAATSDALLIFKTRSTYALTGDDPQTWIIRPLFTEVGCASQHSIVQAENAVYWWSQDGPTMWAGSGGATLIGRIALPTICDDVNLTRLSQISGAVDEVNKRILWTYPEAGQTRNTAILPWSYRYNCWEADMWDPMDLVSLCAAEDAVGVRWVFGSNYSGQVFKMQSGTNDGVPSGTVSGTFVALATTATTISGTGFLTTGNGLVERKVTVLDSDGTVITPNRTRITSNTSSVITFSDTITGLIVGDTYTYYIGGPEFEWQTARIDFGDPWLKKRYEFLFTQGAITSASTSVEAELVFDGLDTKTRAYSISMSTAGSGGVWDESTWDDFTFESSGGKADQVRLRIAKTGWIVHVIYRQRVPDQTFVLFRTGLQAEALTTKQ